jgi:hypothetical protein
MLVNSGSGKQRVNLPPLGRRLPHTGEYCGGGANSVGATSPDRSIPLLLEIVMMPRTPLLLLSLLLGGCASGGGGAAGTSATASMTAAAGPRGSANVIVAAEIPGSGAQNALEVIQQLRPSMLRTRNGSTGEGANGTNIVIYVDGVRAGERQTLTAVPAANIREIRYLNASDATTRFGTGHPVGAILVATKR